MGWSGAGSGGRLVVGVLEVLGLGVTEGPQHLEGLVGQGQHGQGQGRVQDRGRERVKGPGGGQGQVPPAGLRGPEGAGQQKGLQPHPGEPVLHGGPGEGQGQGQEVSRQQGPNPNPGTGPAAPRQVPGQPQQAAPVRQGRPLPLQEGLQALRRAHQCFSGPRGLQPSGQTQGRVGKAGGGQQGGPGLGKIPHTPPEQGQAFPEHLQAQPLTHTQRCHPPARATPLLLHTQTRPLLPALPPDPPHREGLQGPVRQTDKHLRARGPSPQGLGKVLQGQAMQTHGAAPTQRPQGAHGQLQQVPERHHAAAQPRHQQRARGRGHQGQPHHPGPAPALLDRVRSHLPQQLRPAAAPGPVPAAQQALSTARQQPLPPRGGPAPQHRTAAALAARLTHSGRRHAAHVPQTHRRTEAEPHGQLVGAAAAPLHARHLPLQLQGPHGTQRPSRPRHTQVLVEVVHVHGPAHGAAGQQRTHVVEAQRVRENALLRTRGSEYTLIARPHSLNQELPDCRP
mmetsp:Transcript_27851/g.39553  ORF Transcript_27851/g.39553 Transcript_27851/m.39553 type:complete len:508 (+) Transcript_27851:63-1586(+)